jgi:inner membrane protein
MAPETITWIWIIAGTILLLSELIVPGLVVVFFGTGAILAGILRWAGIISGIFESFFTWLIISLVLVLVFRRFALKLFPSDSNYQLTEEDVEAIGKTVTVTKTIHEDSTDGRISYGGTTWPAISNGGIIKKGKKARLLYRDNISWVVEPDDDTGG